MNTHAQALHGPGTYALLFELPRARTLPVGRLGRCRFEEGAYAYVGSAFGPGGLHSRLKRHLRHAGVRHWHVDYFKRIARLEEVWISRSGRRLEHEWARKLERTAGVCVPVPSFGSSDCRCRGHLFRADRRRLREELSKLASPCQRF